MMQTARRASLLVAFCLLASAATGYAEGVWVLWSRFEPSTSKDPAEIAILTAWRRISTQPNQGACMTLADQMSRSWEKDREREHPGSTKIVMQCLPDTVDPRVPKGTPR